MFSSARQTIICFLLVIGTSVCVQSQTITPRVATASISGKVTIKGKPAVGVTVIATKSRAEQAQGMKRDRARTDQSGSYRIANLPAGTYDITTLTPALVPANQADSLVIAEGEQVENVDFSLVPGGVITGRITNSDGEPLIGEHVRIEPLHEDFTRRANRQMMDRLYQADNSTDDRGIYRAFGLPPGKYKVAVGRTNSSLGGGPREFYRDVFYPSVTDPAKATIIEVKEGSETDRIDIVVGLPVGTFKVSGQIVDSDTGKPIPNLQYGVGQRYERDGGSGSASSMGGDYTNANGEFRVENLGPGKYTIFTAPQQGSDLSAGSITFDVVDRDIPNLVIKATRGSSLSGVAVIDGNENLPVLNGVRLCAVVQSTESFSNPASNVIGNDGSFTISGVRSGPVRLWLCGYSGDRRQFEIIRVERDGIPQPETFNLREREHLAGLRVILKYSKLTGAIRGQVKVENGELPPVSRLALSLWPLEDNLEPKRSSSLPAPQLDSRGRFLIENLPAGHYRLTVYMVEPDGRRTAGDRTTQRVTVTDDIVTEVTLIIKPKPDDKAHPERD